jgi:NADPH-dependent glutamate synthase beta subunit-like oxidoreductase
VKGEGLSLPWLKYELPHLETALEQLNDYERRRIKPVLIVGAGLSAADAVTICRSSGIPVIHVYRNRTAGLDKMLPENIYPEYHEVSDFGISLYFEKKGSGNFSEKKFD